MNETGKIIWRSVTAPPPIGRKMLLAGTAKSIEGFRKRSVIVGRRIQSGRAGRLRFCAVSAENGWYGGFPAVENVTHWAELPKLPKGKP